MLAAEVETEGILRDVGTTVASALRPTTMVGGPMLGAILLKGIVPLPATALLHPSPLLLPRSRFLLRTLRLLLGLLSALGLLG